MIAYGLGRLGDHPRGDAPTGAWPTARSVDEVSLRGEAWEVTAWEIALRALPDRSEWREAIRSTLQAHLDGGSRLAWIGAEGVPFCDPPQLFDPTCMTRGVLAWMTRFGSNVPCIRINRWSLSAMTIWPSCAGGREGSPTSPSYSPGRSPWRASPYRDSGRRRGALTHDGSTSRPASNAGLSDHVHTNPIVEARGWPGFACSDNANPGHPPAVDDRSGRIGALAGAVAT